MLNACLSITFNFTLWSRGEQNLWICQLTLPLMLEEHRLHQVSFLISIYAIILMQFNSFCLCLGLNLFFFAILQIQEQSWLFLVKVTWMHFIVYCVFQHLWTFSELIFCCCTVSFEQGQLTWLMMSLVVWSSYNITSAFSNTGVLKSNAGILQSTVVLHFHWSPAEEWTLASLLFHFPGFVWKEVVSTFTCTELYQLLSVKMWFQ
jgi:hypothetical protein